MSCGLSWGFFGSGRFGAACLELLSAWRPPSWIVTAPPKPAGRGRSLSHTAVEAFAAAGLPSVPLVRSADASSDGAVLALGEEFRVDFCFVIDFGQLIREPLLRQDERVGCLNIHPSMLPEYRGAAPIQRALMDCRPRTGVTAFKLAPGMDSGPVLLRREITISGDDNAETLLERAAAAGTAAFIEHASSQPMEGWAFEAQDGSLATNAPKIRPDEERIDWGRPSGGISGQVRALAPRPGAWTTVRGRRLRVLSAAPAPEDEAGRAEPGTLCGVIDGGVAVHTGEGCLSLLEVQPEGKRAQRALDWWNGLRPAKGERLS
ncbi:MAG: methionyl-tRNA formyltransferase [Synergistaceae bacterium]|nr:methionyl-tRNA formyltransferase [Synergistaceae bacterium]